LADAAVRLPLGAPSTTGKLLPDLTKSFTEYGAWLAGGANSNAAPLAALAGAAPDVRCLSDAILVALDEQLRGRPATAFRALADALAQPAIAAAIGLLEASVATPEAIGTLYRFRLGEDSRDWGRGELFHMPFQLRHNVGVQRYSITGVPCLYLGATSYACWEELRRPDRSKVAVSAFQATQDLKILNLAWFPHDFTSAYAQAPLTAPIFDAYFKLWPLVAACSVPRANKIGNFHEEYVIPQLLLQWVRDAKFDGIRYASVHAPKVSLNLRANFVFPVQTSAERGYCAELAQKFKMTKPVGWHALWLLPPIGARPQRSGHLGGLYERAHLDEPPLSYTGSDFWKLDAILAERPMQRV
jgi:hypothetical protein